MSATENPAQQKAGSSRLQTKSKPGIVSGRVFAITQGGDLKPARMALVSAMPSMESFHWLLSVEKEIKELMDAHIRNGAPWGNSLTCKEELDAYDHAILRSFESSSSDVVNKKSAEHLFVGTKADEDGNFELSLPRGSYALIARGRAGFDDAVWVEKWVTVESDKTTRIKLSSPEKSCLDVGEAQ